jgi:hypothetical protein
MDSALYLTLRDSPYGEMSDSATVAVSTCGVPLLIYFISSEMSRFVTATVAAFDVSPNDLSRNITTRFRVFCNTRHVKKDFVFFGP